MTPAQHRTLKYTLFALTLLWAAAQLPSLATNPPLWFDEAWSLMVAKNWAATGIYGRDLGTDFVSGMGMAMPVTSTGWFAVLFRFTGFSVFSARLLALTLTTLSIFLIYHLARALYDETVAALTLVILLFFSLPGTHPFWFGKQALAEPFLIFYIVAGFLLFALSFNKHPHAFWPAVLLLGLGTHAKSHALPFLLAGLLGTAGVAAWHKETAHAKRYLTASLGTLGIFLLTVRIDHLAERGLPPYGGPIMQAVFKNIGLVIHPTVRAETAQYLLTFGWLLLLALAFAFRQHWRTLRTPPATPTPAYLRLAYFGFVFSWVLWFASLSVGWERYFYPVFFLSAPLQAQLLRTGFTRLWRGTRGQTKRVLYTALALIPLGLFATFTFASNVFTAQLRNDHLAETVAYIQANVPAGQTVESYDGEIFLYLDDHLAHFPPDHVQIQLVREGFLFAPKQPIDYDPYTLAPAVIVSGPLDKTWQLYPETQLAEHGYALVYENESYRVYQSRD